MSNDSGCSWPSLRVPWVTEPVDNASGVSVITVITLKTVSLVAVDHVDTHVSSDWQVRTAPNGGGTLVWSSMADIINKNQVTIAGLTLTAGVTYYNRVRQNTATRSSGWSADSKFST